MWHSMITRSLTDQKASWTKDTVSEMFDELHSQQPSWKISAKKREVIIIIVYKLALQ